MEINPDSGEKGRREPPFFHAGARAGLARRLFAK